MSGRFRNIAAALLFVAACAPTRRCAIITTVPLTLTGGLLDPLRARAAKNVAVRKNLALAVLLVCRPVQGRSGRQGLGRKAVADFVLFAYLPREFP